jgi:GntR family transcriptional regulator/MocR family aminotransferase
VARSRIGRLILCVSVAIQWSGLGPELLLRLDRDSDQPLRSQLETGLRDAIRDGRLPAGERLPSSRELARELGVSRGLVQECYGQLLSEGYLDSQVGSATRVAARAYPEFGSALARAPRPAASPRLIADFRSGVPDLASFPRSDWVWAMREACREVATAELDYGDPRGSGALREVVAGYLRRVRAAAADQENLIVCTGFAQGLNLVLRVVSQLGVGRVAFEDPGYGDVETSTSVRSAGLAGAQAVHVPVDDLGVDVAALAASGARAVVVTPAHQSPTGVVLAASRRHALVEWASRHDAFIVEDDYDSEFRYDREPVGVLQGIAPDRVFTLGTVSKSLAPAVRLGWVVAPPRVHAAHLAQVPVVTARPEQRGGAPCSSTRWGGTRPASGSPAWRPGSTRWGTCRPRPTKTRWWRRRGAGRSGCTGWPPSARPRARLRRSSCSALGWSARARSRRASPPSRICCGRACCGKGQSAAPDPVPARIPNQVIPGADAWQTPASLRRDRRPR